MDGIWVPILQSGAFVWAPPPAATQVAIEELRKARHKRFANSFHVFACQKLLKYEWIGQLYKVADIVLEIKANQLYWPSSCHENLIIAVCFPFIKHRPWQLRNTPALLDVGRLLRKV